MRKATDLIPGIVFFIAGMAVGVLNSSPKPKGEAEKSTEGVGDTPATGEMAATPPDATGERLDRIEARLDEHAAKLAEVPTTSQIVSVMEQLMAKTMTSLDERLTTQAHSIEVLKTTVSQTDSLLERVLESLDSLQTYSETSESGEDALFSRAV